MEIEKEIATLKNQVSEIQEILKPHIEEYREEEDLKGQKEQTKFEEKQEENRK